MCITDSPQAVKPVCSSRGQTTAGMKGIEEMANQKQQNKQAILEAIRTAVEKLQSPVMTRELVEELTGGAIRTRHLANLDSLQLGIPGGFTMGRRKCYLTENFLKWIESRLEV